MVLIKETASKALPHYFQENALGDKIRRLVYKLDERLPTEHEFAMEFEVSHPAVREVFGFGQLKNVVDL